jgi:carboxylesterase type B
VFGESAGAASTSFHLLSAKSQPFFKSAILQSGSALSPWAVATNKTALERSLATAHLVGCDRSAATTDLITCLRSKSAKDISEKLWSVPGELRNVIAPTSPIVDGFFIQDHPLEILRKGEAKNTDIIAGMNQDEGTYFLVYSYQKLFNLSYPDRVVSREEFRAALGEFIKNMPPSAVDAVAFEYATPTTWEDEVLLQGAMDDVLGDYAFKCPVVDFAREYAKQGHDVYMYNFKHVTSANPWPAWLGAMHGYEIDHVFGAPLNESRAYSEQEKRLSTQMLKYWTNFAKTM